LIKDWGDIEKAQVLVIGHDPRLRNSDTIAEYVLFADYYAQNKNPKSSKYGIAKNTFEQIFDLTCNKFKKEDLYITNLCNEELPRPNKGTVYLTEKHALEGIDRLEQILNDSNIKYIFPTSQQVNYWLQRLGFYSYIEEYMKGAEPRPAGVRCNPPSYAAKKSSVFREFLCGNVYTTTDRKYKIIPILHPKHYPLKGNFTVFEQNYERIRGYFRLV
jgi:hypothetical protein